MHFNSSISFLAVVYWPLINAILRWEFSLALFFFSLQVVFSVIRIWMRAERTRENRGDWHLNIHMDRDVWRLTVRDQIWCHLKGGPLTWLNLEAKCSWRHMSPAHNMFPKWRRQPFCFKAQSIRVSNYWPSGFIHINGAVWIFFSFFLWPEDQPAGMTDTQMTIVTDLQFLHWAKGQVGPGSERINLSGGMPCTSA